MIAVILLLILAVLLFGSSVVTGAIGVIFGFIVAAVALIYLNITYDLTLADILLYAFVGVVLIAILIFVLATLYDHINSPEKLMRRYKKAEGKKHGFGSWHREQKHKEEQHQNKKKF